MVTNEDISILTELYNAGRGRKDAVSMIDKIDSQDLISFMSSTERDKYIDIKRRMKAFIQGGGLENNSTYTPPIVTTTLPPPEKVSDIPEIPKEDIQPASQYKFKPGEIIDKFWDLPSWGKDLVVAEPESNRDTLIMDILNAIDTAGEERAKNLMSRLPPETKGEDRMSRTAKQLVQTTGG